MAYFLFVDESGIDHKNSPYEVLAGIAIEDRDLWNLIRSIQELELRIFGQKYSVRECEIKGKKFLKKKVFKHATWVESIGEDYRRELSKKALNHGESSGKWELAALAQAKLQFVEDALAIASRYHCSAFASIVSRESPAVSREYLRKDYSYLFERFFYFLEDMGRDHQGIIVFDQKDKKMCHVLLEQMDEYFKKTTKGKRRSKHIIPEPLFVFSDLTSGVQLADLVAYIISWGVRFSPQMKKDRRSELSDLAQSIMDMRYLTKRDYDGLGEKNIWSFSFIEDLRPSPEQLRLVP